jgi:hypothetical protein
LKALARIFLTVLSPGPVFSLIAGTPTPFLYLYNNLQDLVSNSQSSRLLFRRSLFCNLLLGYRFLVALAFTAGFLAVFFAATFFLAGAFFFGAAFLATVFFAVTFFLATVFFFAGAFFVATFFLTVFFFAAGFLVVFFLVAMIAFLLFVLLTTNSLRKLFTTLSMHTKIGPKSKAI